jgi:membrane protein YdbS with pleckstrin-like domain
MSSERTLLSATPAHGGADAGEETLFDGYPAIVASLGALVVVILTLGLALIPLWWRSRSHHYRVTTRRVVTELGVLSKNLEQLDLYRVSDYTVERPFSQRLFGTGNLILRTLDKTSPTVALNGIRTDVVALYERVRAATEAEKTKRGAVRLMEVES